MKSRWIIASAAALALALLTLPMLRARQGTQLLDGARASSRVTHAGPGGHPACDVEGHAKYDFVLKNEHNVPVKMTDFKGKVLLLNFWATWCGPCKSEIPLFVELYSKYKDKGLAIVGVSIDDSPEQLQSFMKEYRMNYPVLQMKPEVEDFWGPFYGYPTT
ncbi:MAG TPA: TlpA disulfide reductase family protein, partial [Vicinamibacterales bacterium]